MTLGGSYRARHETERNVLSNAIKLEDSKPSPPAMAERYGGGILRALGLAGRMGRGEFRRAGDRATWIGAIYGIQQADDCEIHPGGKTALAVLGTPP